MNSIFYRFSYNLSERRGLCLQAGWFTNEERSFYIDFTVKQIQKNITLCRVIINHYYLVPNHLWIPTNCTESLRRFYLIRSCVNLGFCLVFIHYFIFLRLQITLTKYTHFGAGPHLLQILFLFLHNLFSLEIENCLIVFEFKTSFVIAIVFIVYWLGAICFLIKGRLFLQMYFIAAKINEKINKFIRKVSSLMIDMNFCFMDFPNFDCLIYFIFGWWMMRRMKENVIKIQLSNWAFIDTFVLLKLLQIIYVRSGSNNITIYW